MVNANKMIWEHRLTFRTTTQQIYNVKRKVADSKKVGQRTIKIFTN